MVRHPLCAALLLASSCAQHFIILPPVVLSPGSDLRAESDSTKGSVDVRVDAGSGEGGCGAQSHGGVSVRVDKSIFARRLIASFSLDEARKGGRGLERDLRSSLGALKNANCGFRGAATGELLARMPRLAAETSSTIPLRPGMRLRVLGGGAYLDTGLGGSAESNLGDLAVDVLGDTLAVRFGARSRIMRTTTRPFAPASTNRVHPAVLPVDIEGSETALPEWWVFYPKDYYAVDSKPDATTTLSRALRPILAGAATWEQLDAMQTKFESSCLPAAEPLASTAIRCVTFVGHTDLVVEIPIRVQGALEYVPLGTTLGDVLARELGPVDESPNARDYVHDRVLMRRRFGVRLVAVQLDFSRLSGWRDLMLVQGDVVTW